MRLALIECNYDSGNERPPAAAAAAGGNDTLPLLTRR